MGPILNGYGVLGVFLTRKSPPVNRASQVALRDLEQFGKGTVSGRCDSQIALFKTERRS